MHIELLTLHPQHALVLEQTRTSAASGRARPSDTVGATPTTRQAKACLQVDDDVAVNVAALTTYLKDRRTQGNLYLVRLTD